LQKNSVEGIKFRTYNLNFVSSSVKTSPALYLYHPADNFVLTDNLSPITGVCIDVPVRSQFALTKYMPVTFFQNATTIPQTAYTLVEHRNLNFFGRINLFSPESFSFVDLKSAKSFMPEFTDIPCSYFDFIEVNYLVRCVNEESIGLCSNDFLSIVPGYIESPISEQWLIFGKSHRTKIEH
jgi:hypothetical protein